MKKILLIATGGTIASKYTKEGLSPQISAEELLEYIPTAREFCTIDTVQPFSLDSTNVCADHWLQATIYRSVSARLNPRRKSHR